MGMKARSYTIAGALILFLAAWLFLGVYRDREFGDSHLFLKHRPTFKVRFYAPIGESDTRVNDLAPASRYEEIMYREFVEDGGGYKRSIPLWY